MQPFYCAKKCICLGIKGNLLFNEIKTKDCQEIKRLVTVYSTNSNQTKQLWHVQESVHLEDYEKMLSSSTTKIKAFNLIVFCRHGF